MPTDRATLPTGTVTFVFTDIEGSTGLLGRLGDRYAAVLERHQELLRESFAAHGGLEVSTEGDSFFVVFPVVRDAVLGVVEAQRALREEPWPDGERVRVRAGVHTGEGRLGGDDYAGADVNRTARIMSAAHGGQVLASATTRALAESAGLEGISFRDLGDHRLKDLPRPEELHQVLAPDLEDEFPPVRSIESRTTNLPQPLTTFVGRRRQLDEIGDAVRQSRLVTLSGPGGTGKTRLSIAAGAELLPEFEDGVWFVPLAPVTDPALVMSVVAEVVGIPEDAGRMPLESVAKHLRSMHALLILDNLEQVVQVAGDVGQLLNETEQLRILTTSREPLGVHGEREYPVPPLGLPDPEALPSLDGLGQYEAVALFIQRAATVKPGFEVTNENAPAVAEICTRLDGLPLAIELAAARVKILSPRDILRRLERSLSILGGGGRDRPSRQQTLRDAIAWSHDLLDDEERGLFAHLSVFAGPFDLDAADAVAGVDEGDAFEGVASLVNKSLLRQIETPGGDTRFLLLETIRSFAADRLRERPEATDVHRRHADHFIALAERAAPLLLGDEQVRWLDALTEDLGNLRAATTWAEEAGDLDRALRLGASLWRFWQMRGHLREGREVLERLLAAAGDVDPAVRAGALEAAGGLAYWTADMHGAERNYSACLEVRRDLGDRKEIAEATYNLAFAFGMRTGGEQDLERALGLIDESLALFRELGDEQGTAKALWGMGDMLYEADRIEEAEGPLVESLEVHRRLGNRFDEAWALFILGLARQKLGRSPEARADLRRSLELLAEAGDTSGVPLALGGLAAIAADEKEWQRAVRLAAAAQTLEEVGGGGLTGVNEQIEGWEELRRAHVDDETYRQWWDEGVRMSFGEAVAYALSAPEPAPG
jgi:predicted ATPase/class 3 adenylate cyclase